MSNDNDAPSMIDLKAYAEEVATKTAAKIAMAQAEKDAKEKAEADEEAKFIASEKAEQDKVKTIVEAGMEGAERLTKDLEDRVSTRHEDLEKVVEELRTDLTEKKEEIEAILVHATKHPTLNRMSLILLLRWKILVPEIMHENVLHIHVLPYKIVP